MITHVIVLEDGTEISSGSASTNALMNVSVTELVNDDVDVSIGSVCATVFKANLITPGAGLNISAGSKFTAYRIVNGERIKIGIFTAEKPSRPSANRYQITAYDNVTKLNKDITEWVNSLGEWPYSIGSLAKMVCKQCDVNLATADFPNSTFMTYRPVLSDGITGRQIMKWIAEIAGKFCVANPDGDLEFRWYKENEIFIEPSGEKFIYLGTLSYSDFETEKIDSVKMRLADSEDGALWPEGESKNPYVIKGNRLLNSNIVDSTRNVLDVLFDGLKNVSYTPCKVTIPADAMVHAGDIVKITDRNGVQITSYVMKASYSGQKAKIESTGNKKRNSGDLTNFLSNKDIKDYVQDAAQNAVNSQSQQEIFDKLTGGGAESGIYLKDGALLINANFIQSGFISSDIIRAGRIRSTDFAVEELQQLYPIKTYTEVEYIETTGTQYINTGFYPNQDSRIVCEYMYFGGTGIYGARDNTSSDGFCMRVTNSKWQPQYNDGMKRTSIGSDSTKWHIADQNKEVFYIDGDVGVEFDYADFDVPNPVIIGGTLGNKDGVPTLYGGDCRYRACQLYDNGVLVRDLVPCYRNIDGEVGMYDKLNGVFYGNAGTGEFVAGDAVETVPEPIYPSPILYPNNGEQIIRGVEIDFASGVIHGVFWSDDISKLKQENALISEEMKEIRERMSKLEEGMIYPKSAT